MQKSITIPKSNRLISIDVFRGITIVGMILVNNQGSWDAIYPMLAHSKWHGWTPADLIFPFFLFIVGVVIPFSFAGRINKGDDKKKILFLVLKRAIIIFGIGIFLNGFPYFAFFSVRVPGVLQRIALCYLFSSIVALHMRIRWQAITAFVILIIYWAAMKLIPVPGYGAGVLTFQGNLASYVDSILLYGRMMDETADPEGLLSTISAISTTLFGVLTGHWLQSAKSSKQKLGGLLIIGIAAVMAGWIMNIWFPINKFLWTGSYAVFTAGMALLCLGLCYWLVDIKGYRRWGIPFEIYGANAIAVYAFSSMADRITHVWKLVSIDGSKIKLKTYLFENLFASWASPVNASLFYSLAFVLIWMGLALILYRKRIFIKI